MRRCSNSAFTAAANVSGSKISMERSNSMAFPSASVDRIHRGMIDRNVSNSAFNFCRYRILLR
jgi:histone H3/H4